MRFIKEKFLIIKEWSTIHRKKIYLFTFILYLIFISGFIFTLYKSQKAQNLGVLNPSGSKNVPTTSLTPTTTPFTKYKIPILTKSDKYNVYLIGDSMIHAFGPRGGIFNEILSRAYPGTFFEVSNYAEANQSILTLSSRLRESVQADHDLLLKPIIEGDPDLIIIESFGYNPLSQLGIEGGLKKQEELLTEIMTTLTNRFPKTVIMFLTTIAPDKKTYSENVTHSSAEGRWAQAEERIEYITQHIKYAQTHNIPLINVYNASLDSTGDGDTLYINPDDNIHPSQEGLVLMGRIMTKRIMEENIFPKSE